jgi:hypothetical protein
LDAAALTLHRPVPNVFVCDPALKNSSAWRPVVCQCSVRASSELWQDFGIFLCSLSRFPISISV